MMDPILKVVFYRTTQGNEPVREWLQDMSRNTRKSIGEDIKTAQFGWPLGMPLIRKMEKNLWEVRTRIERGVARVFFTVVAQQMVLLHGFIKKSGKTPTRELDLARKRRDLVLGGDT